MAMPLKEYKKKRNFQKTPEPRAKINNSPRALHFCIQKHDARRLHYDFRLEHRGVLLSWAVPKGPSLDPEDKRLAIKVEDHPLEYQYFEGVIPKGNYGAGTVEIWDNGFYTTPEGEKTKEIEEYISQGLIKGHFSVILQGEKLTGEFVFQKLKKDDSGDNSWLLMKKKDFDASKKEIIPSLAPTLEKKPKKKALPKCIAPMLATLIKQPFDDEDWIFEIKWDGYRALALIEQGKVQLRSRNQLLWNEKFPSILHALEKIKETAILDGEVVALDAEGKPDFQRLQNYGHGGGDLVYYVFDLLFWKGQDIRDKPLLERKEILEKLLERHSLANIRFGRHIVADGIAFFSLARQAHLEGIIGKKSLSTYQSARSHDWVKIKAIVKQEFVIGGFTEPKGSRKKFGALLVGVYNENKELEYTGHVGSGFDEHLLAEIFYQLTLLIQKQAPFQKIPKVNGKATWVKPQLVCEVSFSNWTKENRMRHPIFQGMRTDKPGSVIRKEVPGEVPKKGKSRKLISNIEGIAPVQLQLTHLEKVYWPEEGYTKGDLLDYYQSVASYILPYLKDRPITLHRFPSGIEGQEFYQKDLGFALPEGIKTFPLEQEGKVNHYLLIDTVESLLYAINLGSIDLHPFISRCQSLEHPDYSVIDLDPHDVPFENLIGAALLVHELLTLIDCDHYIKTSGGKGLHIVIPLYPKYTFEQSRQFAEIVCREVHKKMPSETSLERDPKKRPNKVYLDFLQNRKHQTTVAPYAVRPRPHALVSTPLLWEEVNEKLDISDFTIKTIKNRLKKKGDLYLPSLKGRSNMQKVLARLQKII